MYKIQDSDSVFYTMELCFFLITLKKLPSLNNGKPTRYNWLIKMGPYMNNYTEKNFKPKYFKSTLILF